MSTHNTISDTLLLVSKEIEGLSAEKSIDLIDACVLYCEERGVEIEYLGEIIERNQHLKAKIQREAEDRHYIKRSSRLFSL